jgi:peptide chain release factor 2
VSVALLDGEVQKDIDLTGTIETFYRASGKGGQNRNKVETACRLQHPSGITVTAERERSKLQNRQNAWGELERRLRVTAKQESQQAVNDERVGQLGSRSWTWCQWRDEVTSPSGKKCRYSELTRGRGFARLSS